MTEHAHFLTWPHTRNGRVTCRCGWMSEAETDPDTNERVAQTHFDEVDMAVMPWGDFR